jgi:hypothetical protein
MRFLFEAYLEIVIAALVKFKLDTYSVISLDDTIDACFAFFWSIVAILAPFGFTLYFWNKGAKLMH